MFVESSATDIIPVMSPSSMRPVCVSVFCWLPGNQLPTCGGWRWMNLPQQVSGHNAHGHNGISRPQTTDSPTIFSIEIPLTQFVHGWRRCPGSPLLWRSIVKSLTHRQDSSPFGSLSKGRMDMGIRPGERGELKRGGSEGWKVKRKCCSKISASVAFKLLR